MFTVFGNNVTAPAQGDGNLVKPCRRNVFELCPSLAESWESNKEFTQWTFKIRDNVLWHDGTPFTARDAKFWVDLAVFGAQAAGNKRLPSRHLALFGDVEKVEALDGNRIRITVKQPVPILPHLMASDAANRMAHPRHLMEPRIQQGEVNLGPQEVGNIATGPFKLLSHEKGTRVQFRRYEKYWEKNEQGRQLPFLDGIDMAIIADAGAMDAAFRVGKLDAGSRSAGHVLSRERQAQYIKDLGDKVWFGQTLGFPHSLYPNLLKPGPLQDVRVRRAIHLYIDRQAAIPAVLGGFGTVFTVYLPDSPWPAEDYKTWPGLNPATKTQDRAEARRLLAEAGYEKGLTITMICFRPPWVLRCEWLSGQLREIGITLNLDIVDAAGLSARARAPDYDMGSHANCSGMIPESCAAALRRHKVNPTSWAKHDDPKVDELFDRLNGATSYDARLRIYRELERYVFVEQLITIPAWSHYEVVPYRSYVKGHQVPAAFPANNADFGTVWLDK
jgi:peptide/nickel transport system substrate-binding protein